MLPLKLWRPRWFDGVALTTGAIAPDVRYAFLGVGPEWQSHTLTALVWWCLPVALLGAWLVRATVATLAAHLPHLGPLALPDYGVLATVRHPWQITAGSALLGAASHIAWDYVTHTVAWLRILFGIDWDQVSDVAWCTVPRSCHGRTVVRLLCVTAGALLVAAVAVQAMNAKSAPAETPKVARESRSEPPPSSPGASPPPR
ncbi:DUF4184 family protein [Micromonospora purpureochromogenes]|uniref:DUF4184 family protein n=1 Tax=Micromonospora purpureochromogenes TaxID=47872 RepID=UPI0033E22389